MSDERFGALLRRLRTERGLTLRGVSDRAGLSVTHLSDIENERRSPPARATVFHLAKVLDVPVRGLLIAHAMSSHYAIIRAAVRWYLGEPGADDELRREARWLIGEPTPRGEP